jgi:hypothetical protein
MAVEVFSGTLPLPCCSLVLFPAALTPIRTCDRSRSSNLTNAISEEELEAVQSKPTNQAVGQIQVRQRAHLTFQSGSLISPVGQSFLLSVALEFIF